MHRAVAGAAGTCQAATEPAGDAVMPVCWIAIGVICTAIFLQSGQVTLRPRRLISLTTGDPSPRRPGPRASSRRRDVELVKFCVTIDSSVWGSNLHIYVPVSHELDCLFDSSHSRGPPKGHGTSHISAGDDIVHEIATASRQAYRHYAASARVRSKLPNFKTDAAASTPPPHPD